MYVYIYIYIYIHTHTHVYHSTSHLHLCPISLLRLSPLRFLDSKLPGDSFMWTWIKPYKTSGNSNVGSQYRNLPEVKIGILDSNLPGILMWTWEFRPLQLRFCGRFPVDMRIPPHYNWDSARVKCGFKLWELTACTAMLVL